MNIPLHVAQAQGHHGVKGAAHGAKGGRPPLDLTYEDRIERRRAQQAAYRRRKGISERSTMPSGHNAKYFAIWGKLPGEPLTPEEYAEREPLWNAKLQKHQEARREKEPRGQDRLKERLEHIKQYERAYEPLKPYRAAASTGRNEPCPCGSGRKFKKCCG